MIAITGGAAAGAVPGTKVVRVVPLDTGIPKTGSNPVYHLHHHPGTDTRTELTSSGTKTIITADQIKIGATRTETAGLVTPGIFTKRITAGTAAAHRTTGGERVEIPSGTMRKCRARSPDHLRPMITGETVNKDIPVIITMHTVAGLGNMIMNSIQVDHSGTRPDSTISSGIPDIILSCRSCR